MVWAGRMQFEHFVEGQPPQIKEMGPGDAFHVTPRLRHRMIAIEDTDVFEVSTTELDDVVRLEDAYGRKGTSKAPWPERARVRKRRFRAAGALTVRRPRAKPASPCTTRPTSARA